MEKYKKIYISLAVVLAVLLVILVMRDIRQVFQNRYYFTSSSTTVIKQLRSLNRLETASFTIEKVIDAGTTGTALQQLLFGDKLLLIAQGQVIAGFDLSQMKDSDIQVQGRTLRMTLPPPQIFSSTLDSNETRVYDRRQGLLTKGDKDLESKARAEAESVIRKAACDGHILEQASNNGRNQLTALFKTLGFTTVILTIPVGGC